MEFWNFVFMTSLMTTQITAVLPSKPWVQPEDVHDKSVISPFQPEATPLTQQSDITPGEHKHDCPAPPVCSCSDINNVIDCSGRGLTRVPEFSKSDGLWDLYIKNNNIHNLTDDDFQKIQIEYLDLSNNSLSAVSDNAFRGLENSLKTLHIETNHLEGIPKAVMSLSNISSLKIQQNPITHLDENVMKSLAKTLMTFHFGFEGMVTWPSSVQILNLFELGIYNLPLEELPETAFRNLNISWLYLNSMKLTKLPSSFGDLEKLFFLSFNTDKELTSNGVPSSLFEGLKGLNDLQIINSKLTALPDIFHYITGLFQLEINSVPIREFTSNMLPENSNITIANFNDTLFDEVPSAISEMKQLSVLSLNYNNITTIRSEDFAGLTKLRYISISNAPLKNVSMDAFQTLSSLAYIALDNTALTTVPRAIENVKFDILSLFGNKLICTCESMGWMKNWSGASRIGINGQCSNLGNMQVEDYIKQDIPRCP
ncbi:leucine-rich repeat-containing G-protein coupled receptor 4-like [Pecten maximus]|uniref:leucine-rich repeat-containing G-protein coupled receptor 4-like n=1 Tax=Pecten maximus TaxID=6579 RepID=UPI001458F32D|nr:leucine-rich repeat-containing G-protein coupled receptor 4-like [Pecten maximus]